MKAILFPLKKSQASTVLFDLAVISFVYFTPALSHLLSLPLYLIEPMRLVLVLAMVHTRKNNAYLLAATLPLFSFLVSGHPMLLKTLLITAELLLNVWLFFTLSRLVRAAFPAMMLAILGSKIVYYLLKYAVISMAFLESGLFSTPLLIQLVVMLLLSAYTYAWLKKTAA